MSYNIKEKYKNQDNSAYSFLFIIGFFLLALSINLVKLTRELFGKQGLLKQQTQEFSQLRKQQNRLELSLKQSQTDEYIEAQARKLTLSKPNEIVVIITSPTPKATPVPKPTPYFANYKLWLRVFFSP